MISVPASAMKRRKTVRIWHLVTNQQNMLYMLGAGMVMSPAGFQGKHYKDTLALFPGWVPLFRSNHQKKYYIPANVLDDAYSERKYLVPCIASFVLPEFASSARTLSKEGKVRKVSKKWRKDDIATLIRAPWPISSLVDINFRSNEDKHAFETASKDVSNIDLTSYTVKVAESLFTTAAEVQWLALQVNDKPEEMAKDIHKTHLLDQPGAQVEESVCDQPQESLQQLAPTEQPNGQAITVSPQQSQRPELKQSEKSNKANRLPALEDGRDTIPSLGQAIGGVLAMLYHTANRSDLGLETYLLVTEPDTKSEAASSKGDPVLAELPNWLSGRKNYGQADNVRLFWGVIEALVEERMKDDPSDPIDATLTYLESQFGSIQQGSKPRLETLITEMKDLLGLGSGTIKEVLERNKGSLSRPLLLFCLRKRCMELLEFSHPLLSDAEYILAGILFGVRDAWLKLPKELRTRDLSAFVSFRIADAEYREQGVDLSISPPPRPKPLRELFASPSGIMYEGTKCVALELVNKCDWKGCVQTRVTLQGDGLPESFQRKGSQLVLPGRLVDSMEEVIPEKFLQRLGQWPPIAPAIETEVRERLQHTREELEIALESHTK